jgi:hypothetical protein
MTNAATIEQVNLGRKGRPVIMWRVTYGNYSKTFPTLAAAQAFAANR